MLRHLQLAITAVILVTSIIGFPAAENPISYTYQLMSMQKAYQGNEVTLSLLEKLISMMNASTAAAGVASDIAYGAAGASDGQAIPSTTCKSILPYLVIQALSQCVVGVVSALFTMPWYACHIGARIRGEGHMGLEPPSPTLFHPMTCTN